MDNKYLLYMLIGCFITICLLSYASYVTYSQLNFKLEHLRKELTTLSNLNQYNPRNKLDIISNNTDNSKIIDGNTSGNIENDNKNIDVHNTQIGGECEERDVNSLEKAKNEVEQLQNELQNIDHLINDSDNEEDTTERIDHIINKDEYRDQLLKDTKSIEPLTNEIVTKVHNLDKGNTTSEFDDLENVPSDNNSELNELIQKESELSKNNNEFNINSSIIEENKSIDNLSELRNKDYEESENSDIYINSSKLNTTDNRSSIVILNDIEYNVIYKNFTNKQLRDMCKSNQLIVAGNKKALIERLIDNNLAHLFDNSEVPVNITSN